MLQLQNSQMARQWLATGQVRRDEDAQQRSGREREEDNGPQKVCGGTTRPANPTDPRPTVQHKGTRRPSSKCVVILDRANWYRRLPLPENVERWSFQGSRREKNPR